MIFGKGGASDDPLALMQQGRFKEAVKLLRIKVKRSPSDLMLKLRLAEALEGAGNKEEAAGIYKDEAEASLSGGERSQGLALLKKAGRLLPEDAAIKAKLSHLEKAPDQAAGESFSFDLDSAPQAEAAPPPEEVPPAVLPAPEPKRETPPPPEVLAPQVPPAPEAKTEAPPPPEVVPPQVPPTSAPQGQNAPQEEPAPPITPEDTVGWSAPWTEPSAGDAPSPGEGVAPEVAVEPPEPELEPPVPSGLPASTPDETSPKQIPEEITQVMAIQGLEDPAAAAAAAFEPEEEASLPEDFRPLLQAFFPELKPDQVELLQGLAKPRWLEAGEILVREEEEGDSLFIITRGRLEACGKFEAGEMNLGVLSAGDILGEVAFLKKVPRTATVSAAEPSLVLELPGEGTRAQLATQPAILQHLESVLQERVDKTLAVLKAYTKRPHGNP